jgi:hypothetical protein
MHRDFRFLGELTEDGFISHDREEVRTALIDLEGALFQLGGVVTISAIREQIAPETFMTTGMVMIYDSFSPSRDAPAPAEEPSA